MKILEGIVQGSEQWLQIRAKHFTASEAPAAAGLSKYVSRSDLLKQKSTGLVAEVDGAKQRLFDAGHRAEALARPIVEEILGEDLFPCTCVVEIDGLPLLASLDGMTMNEATIWENKLSNANLRDDIVGGELEAHYWMQIEQQLLVTGAGRCYFTASDGTPEGTIGLWYKSQPERRDQLIAVWKQFAEDLGNYQYVEVVPAAVAAPIEGFGALILNVEGRVLDCNLDAFNTGARAFIERLPRSNELLTDQHFADADAATKACAEAEARIKVAKDAAMAQAADIDKVFRAIDLISEEIRRSRLSLEKAVKARKESIRIEIMQDAQARLAEHTRKLCERIGGFNGRPIISPVADFATAIKGKKSLVSLRNACDTELARAKIAASELADRIEANHKAMGDHAHLFFDFGQTCAKAPDDFANLVAMRVQQHQADEAKREEETRQRIRAEEEARAAEKVKAKQETATIISTEPATQPASTQPQEVVSPALEHRLAGVAAHVPPIRLWQKERDAVAVLLEDLTVAELKAVAEFINARAWR